MITENYSGVGLIPLFNQKFFKDALEENYSESGILLKKITIGMGSNTGKIYGSFFFRVSMSFQRRAAVNPEEVTIFVKTTPFSIAKNKLDVLAVFIRERSIYCDVLPRLEILLDNVKLGAKYIHSIKEPLHAFAFEDLKINGYSIASRLDGLDFDHCKIMLERLGQLHGSSMVLAKKDPSIVPLFQVGMLSKATIEQSGTFDIMFGRHLEQLATLVATWPGFEKISEKLIKYQANFKVKTMSAGMPKPGGISVLNHGNLSTNNFMYSYDKEDPNKPVGVVFIDFQLSYFCSPACDINFFLNSSVQYEVLVNRREELIHIYYKSLTGTLKSLNYPTIPTLKEFQNELHEREAYGLFALYGFLPIVTLDHELLQGCNTASLADEKFCKLTLKRMFANHKLHKYFKYGLKRFDDLGVLDELSC